MKKVLFILIILSFSISTLNSQTIKRYPFKSGKIEYKYEGNTKGNAILYWDDYGNKELNVTETEVKMFGFTQENKESKLTLGEFIYSWNIDKKEGGKMKNPFLVVAKENPNMDWGKLGKETLKSMGYKKSGTETILGKKCEVWKGIGSISIWKSLPLKVEVNILGTKTLQIASKIETDINIPTSLFIIPEEINFKDINKMMENIGGSDDEYDNSGADEEDSEAIMEKMKNLFNNN